MANSTLGQLRKLLAAQPSSQQTDAALVQRFVALREEAAFAALVERQAKQRDTGGLARFSA